MKYLKNKITSLITLLFVTSNMYGQHNNADSNLKDLNGIWKFIPPKESNDTTFIGIEIISNNTDIDLTYWKNSKKSTILGPNTIGFFDHDDDMLKLSDLKNKGQRLYFYKNNPNAPNDSIQYFTKASPSCFASFNGIGTDEYEQPSNGEPNYFLLNFNGRVYEYYQQLTHLPNYIIQSLITQNPDDWNKVRQLLPYDYKRIKTAKSIIHSSPEIPTTMYLVKDDVTEVISEKGDWLQIKYYVEKNGNDTGKTIEGWIKKNDVE